MKKQDQIYMQRAIQLASKGLGKVFPNPMVGAVIVKNNKIIAEAYHQGYGQYHAERAAILKLAGKKPVKNCARGATIYVSLEPCNHHGRTPPCTDIIIEAGIKKVVFAVRDPNPKVKKNDSVKILRKAGIEVIYPVLEKEAQALNKIFFKNMCEQRPYFILKSAMSLDGKIATSSGESKWITGSAARQVVQDLRYQVDAVLVGINTVIKDNPSLTVRLPGKKKDLYKIILGDKKRLDKNTKLLNDPRTIFYAGDLHALAKKLLAEYRICSVLVEGGGTVLAEFIKAGLADEYYSFIAPKIIGGAGLSVVGGESVRNLELAPNLKNTTVSQIGEDFLIHGFF